jgi:FlaA1/EpsC-like NDP-sugar epimerase
MERHMMYDLKNKIILITGGTGSLGKALLNRLLKSSQLPEKIIIFSRDELKQHNMRLEYLGKPNATDEIIYDNFKERVIFKIGDIRNYHSVVNVLKDVDVIFNTAALKQIPVAEYNPSEAIKTNIIGVENIIMAIDEFDMGVETFVGISTDKACKPINAYGMTKSLMERMVIAANLQSDTRYILCRYGNVMASRGSVIPLFKEQILSGKEITITTNDMTRFMMNLDQAVDTVLETYKKSECGNIFIPKIKSSMIMDIAIAMRGDKNIPIHTIGIRPGEKVHEVLISSEEMPYVSDNGNYYIIHSSLPELYGNKFKNCYMDEYSSSTNLMSMEETKELLMREKLL